MRKRGATAVLIGGPSDFVALYEGTVTDVYSYLASRVGDWATAEDLTQDVFVAGARHVAAGDGGVDLAWLIGVARHKLVDHWRAQQRRERNLALAHAEQTRQIDKSAPIDTGRAAAVLADLNPTYRAALVLRHV